MYRLVALFGFLASGAACDSAFRPESSTGSFALQPSTQVVLETPSARIEILADTLRLNPDGTAQRVVRESLDFIAHPDTTLTHEEPYRYRWNGRTIELEYVCPMNALCSAPPHLWGEATADGLELRSAIDPRPLLRYRRLIP